MIGVLVVELLEGIDVSVADREHLAARDAVLDVELNDFRSRQHRRRVDGASRAARSSTVLGACSCSIPLRAAQNSSAPRSKAVAIWSNRCSREEETIGTTELNGSALSLEHRSAAASNS